MEKKIYIAPVIKVRKFEIEEMLAGSTITGISDTPATGGGRSKDNAFPDEEDEVPSYNFNVWGD